MWVLRRRTAPGLSLSSAKVTTSFLGCAAEDGGRLSDELVDVIDEACASIGGSRGEQQAVATYWRQRLAVANARGVAKVIKARTPFCNGDHHPLQPHHFGHVQAVAPPCIQNIPGSFRL